MDASEQLQLWRTELVAEHAELKQELASVREDLQNAETHYAQALTEWTQLRDFTASGIGWHQDLAGELYARLELARRETLKAASGERGAAAARVKSLQERIGGRQLAIEQIDRALTSAKVIQLEPPEPSRRKTHAPVEYDDVMPPREVAQ